MAKAKAAPRPKGAGGKFLARSQTQLATIPQRAVAVRQSRALTRKSGGAIVPYGVKGAPAAPKKSGDPGSRRRRVKKAVEEGMGKKALKKGTKKSNMTAEMRAARKARFGKNKPTSTALAKPKATKPGAKRKKDFRETRGPKRVSATVVRQTPNRSGNARLLTFSNKNIGVDKPAGTGTRKRIRSS